MFKKFYPSQFVESVFDIDYKKVYDMGYRGIVFDIDNTLVHHGDNSNKDVDELFLQIHKIGLKTLLLTNNSEVRVKRFIANIDTLYICDAEKPNTKNYKKAIDMLELNKEEVIFVGDQIFTDILGANRCKCKSILVQYILLPGEKKIGIRRHVEKVILEFYKRNKFMYNILGNISKEDV